jgi:beta-lactamase class D
MRPHGILALALLALGCSGARAATCTALADAVTGQVLRQDGRCDERVTPASTFKIALSLMGYDSGYLSDEHLPALPFKQGYADWMPSWRATTDPTSWIRNSVVWYSQLLTEWLGRGRLQHYVTAFGYGNADLGGDAGQDNGLTHAWLTSSLQISPLEQLAFLHRLIARQLPVSARAYDLTARLTLVGALPDGWEVHGKTGNGFRQNADGSSERRLQVGWFVGWAVQGTRVVAFARCLSDETPQQESAAKRARESLLRDLPALLARLPRGSQRNSSSSPADTASSR